MNGMFRTAAFDPVPEPDEPDEPGGVVPPRAVWISVLALWVPLYASFLAPDTAGDYEILLWLLALVPAFLLAYYRGWRGAAIALALGMGLLAAAQVTSS